MLCSVHLSMKKFNNLGACSFRKEFAPREQILSLKSRSISGMVSFPKEASRKEKKMSSFELKAKKHRDVPKFK